MRSARLGAAVAIAIAAIAGCRPTPVTTPFPVEVGYQMLEPSTASLPAALPPPGESQLGDVLSGTSGHFWAHGRAYLNANVETVWAALHDPCVSRIHTNGGAANAYQVEPSANAALFPLAFDVRVTEDSVVGTVQWVHEYRGGPASEGARQGYGMRYQKIIGIPNVRVQSGSLEIFPAEADPAGSTEVAFVHWLDADRTTVADAIGAVTDWFRDLSGELGLASANADLPAFTTCVGNGVGN